VHPDEQVVTGEAVALELQLAGAGSRGIAALIDIVLVTLLQIILLFVLIAVGPGTNEDTVVTLLIVTQVGAVLGYPVLMETLWRGRTLGKAIMGVRVVRDDGGPIRFRHALVRGLSGVFLDKPGVTYALGAFIPMVAGRRKKRIGDLLAGTIVLQYRVPSRLDAPIEMPPALSGWAATLDLSPVDDALALRLRQFIGRASQLTPIARDSLEHELVGALVTRVGPPPADAPGWAVITAILAERRRRAYLAGPAVGAQAWPAPAPTPVAAPPTYQLAAPYLAPATESGEPPERARGYQDQSQSASTGSPGIAEPQASPPASTTGFVAPG
jgi:uncharacterized RDD family membrane protein YckC